jgi:hypothetical protein
MKAVADAVDPAVSDGRIERQRTFLGFQEASFSAVKSSEFVRVS